MSIKTKTKKTSKFWIKLIVINILVLFALAVTRNYLYVKTELLGDIREVVIGVQKAPTTIQDWYTVTYHPEDLNPDGLVKELLEPFVNNYQEYENASYRVNEDGCLYEVSRDGDMARGLANGLIFYAKQNGTLSDFYVMCNERWFHYQKENSLVFVDFKQFADVIPTLSFERLPYGNESFHDGFMFAQYYDNQDDQGLHYQIRHCGHLEEIAYQGVVISRIQYIGDIQIDEDKMSSFDNVIEVDGIDDVLNYDTVLSLTCDRGFFSLDGLSSEEIIATVRKAVEDNLNIKWYSRLHKQNLYTTFSGGTAGFNNELVDVKYDKLVYADEKDDSTRFSSYTSPIVHSESTITLFDEDLALSVFYGIIDLYSEGVEVVEFVEYEGGKYWHAKMTDCKLDHSDDGGETLSKYCLFVHLEKFDEGYKMVWKDCLDNPDYGNFHFY